VTSIGKAADVPPVVSFLPHTLRSIFSVTSATAAVIRVRSSTTFAGKCGMNTPGGVRSGERGDYSIGAALPIHRPGKRVPR
jgi:hypothetical protein